MKAQLFCGPLPHLTGIRELLWRPEGEDETLALGIGSYPEERTRNRSQSLIGLEEQGGYGQFRRRQLRGQEKGA